MSDITSDLTASSLFEPTSSSAASGTNGIAETVKAMVIAMQGDEAGEVTLDDLIQALEKVTKVTTWAADTAYIADQIVLTPSGAYTSGVVSLVQCTTAFTSASAFSATNWLHLADIGGGSGGTTYTEGAGITISDGEISAPGVATNATAIAAETTRAEGVEAEKAPLSSPEFIDTPTAPTAAAGTNTTQIATTAFVGAAVAGSSSAGWLATVLEELLTTTSATTVLSYTPTTTGLYLVAVYLRVVTASTAVTVTVGATDETAAQTVQVASGTEAVGSYTLPVVAVEAIANEPITVSVTAGTADQVYATAAIGPGGGSGSGSSGSTTAAVQTVSTAGTVTGATGTVYDVTVAGVTITIPTTEGDTVRVANKIPTAGATVTCTSTYDFFTGATGNTTSYTLENPGDSVAFVAGATTIGLF